MARESESVFPLPPLPVPTMRFRRRAWLDFQRAIDPLGPAKPLRIVRH
jgi:hypothetical protein